MVRQCPSCKAKFPPTYENEFGDSVCHYCHHVVDATGGTQEELAERGKKPHRTNLSTEGVETRKEMGLGKERTKIGQVKSLLGRLRNHGLPDMSDEA